MLPQALPHPPHITIPKYIPVFDSHLTTRPRLPSTSSCYEDISSLVSSSVSPVQSASPATVDDDHIASPRSPPGASGNYHYVQRASAAFDSPISPTDMYENEPQNTPYSASYQSGSAVQNYNIHSATHLRESENQGRSYLPDSPSPTDVHPASSFTQSMSAPHSQERFPQSTTHSAYPQNSARYSPSPDGAPGRYARQGVLIDKYPTGNNSYSQNTALDHRRMSEPAVLGSANLYATAPPDPTASRYQQFNFAFNPPPPSSTRSPAPSYIPPLQRGASTGSLRDLRQQHFEYPPNQSWKPEGGTSRQPAETYNNANILSDPLSPLQPNFSGGAVGSPTPGLQYSPIIENPYGPSPPNTGTSTSSAPHPLNININRAHQHPQSGMPSTHVASPPLDDSNSNKTYSFVALPGNSVRKRPRRRYDEIERLYRCSWPECTKAYGTLNHLNAHVTMQKHGLKRSPNEFKELRKQWRKAKKESEIPSMGPMRRSSLNQHHDQDVYERYDSNSPQRQPTNLNLSSISIPHSRSGERYVVAVDDIRYPVDERDDPPEYSIGSRQRYGGAPAPWHPNVTSPSRPGLHQSYTPPSLHQPAHHSQLPQLNVHSSHQSVQPQASPISPHQVPQNRLPPDSTLLTPLPGYQPPSMLAPLQITDLSYPPENYTEVYDEESTGRPGTGHASIGYGSGEEYER
ncbi:hypothetical protein BD779DRAFT_94679 [Infundibulicybe gibba]|nr:hypothetical protein BD779DRAFT_94679 [Infundibulicybe gibba]